MKVKFDSLDRFEIPTMFLCNPGSSTLSSGEVSGIVGSIPNTSDEEIILNFNSISELNFRVHRVKYETDTENKYANSMYNSIQNRRLILVEDIGYFSIQSIKNGYSEIDGYYKDVSASSVEIELQDKMIPFFEDGTYHFSVLMNAILSSMPMWKMGDIAESIINKYRTFKDVDHEKNILTFLQQDVQEAYECVFEYDILNRVINVRDIENSLIDTDIFITKNDVVNNIDISENSDNLYTALRVEGTDGVNIGPINPLGTNVLYDFSYYYSWMDDGLRNKVQSWSNEINNKEFEYYNLNMSYYKNLEKKINKEADIDKFDIQIKMYTQCRENVVAGNSTSRIPEYNTIIEENGGSPIILDASIDRTLASIDQLISDAISKKNRASDELSVISSDLDEINKKIKNIQDSLSIKEYFTPDEFDTLYHYIFEGSFKEEYIIVSDSMDQNEKFQQMKKLYDKAKERLKIASSPSYEFSVSVDGFIFEKDFSHFTDQLNTGSLINVELDDGDVEPLFLSSISINYEDHTTSLTFGNQYRLSKFDIKTMFDDVLGSIKKSSNTLDYIKEIIAPVKDGEIDELKLALQTSRDLTMDSALSSTNQEVTIDASGYTGRKNLDRGGLDPRQIKIVNNSIVFTDDAWNTCKTALGEIKLGDGQSTYGLNAETILGDMIVGGELHIVNDSGDDMFQVIDNKITSNMEIVSDTMDSYNRQLSSFEQDVNGFRSEVQKYSKDVAGYSQQVASFDQTVNGFNSTVNSYSRDLRSYKNEVSNFSQTVSGFNAVVSQYSRDVRGYSKEVSSFNQTVQGFESVVETYTGDVNNYRHEVSRLSQKSNEISATVSTKLDSDFGHWATFGWELHSNSWLIKGNNVKLFEVNHNGAYINGEVHANSGKIGALYIKPETETHGGWIGVISGGYESYIGPPNGSMYNKYVLMFGKSRSSAEAEANYPFRVDKAGNLYAENGYFHGTVRAGKVEYGGSNGNLSGHALTSNSTTYDKLDSGVRTSLGYADNAHSFMLGQVTAENIQALQAGIGTLYVEYLRCDTGKIVIEGYNAEWKQISPDTWALCRGNKS